jgi:hypothetical protein
MVAASSSITSSFPRQSAAGYTKPEKELIVAFVDNRVTRSGRRLRLLLTAVAVILVVGTLPTLALAAATAPSLGSAQSFAVLGGSTVTNTGSTVVTGNLGVSPGSAVTGFPPGIVTGGSIHKADAVALQAQNDVTTAYNSLAGQACTGNLTGKDLGGLTLTSGVYCFSSSAQLTGMLTLDAQGSASSVFIFQVGTTLTTATISSVRVINGGTNCNVYWKVGSSATLGTGTAFVGSILALTSVTLTTGANVSGRALARNGAVTMDTNTVSAGGCGTPATTVTATAIATAIPATLTAIAKTTPPTTATATAIATPIPATLTAIAKGTTTGTPAGGGAGLTPTPVATPAIPSGLPHTGDGAPWVGGFALILGALLLAAGFVTLRARV